jgi:hypothetical protein
MNASSVVSKRYIAPTGKLLQKYIVCSPILRERERTVADIKFRDLAAFYEAFICSRLGFSR